MNFNQIIEEAWEKEFRLSEVDNYEDSLFTIYEPMVKRICVKVWNEALELVAEEVTTKDLSTSPYESYYVVDKESILKLKIDD